MSVLPLAVLLPMAGLQPAAERETPSMPPLRVDDLLTEPLVEATDDGEVWVRHRGTRTCFEDGACTVFPVFGPAAQHEWPVRFELRQVTRGAAAIDVAATGPYAVDQASIAQPRAGLTEVYHLRLDELEQTFVFHELPGHGDLELTIDVDTELATSSNASDEEALVFEHPTLGGVTYGSAYAVDARGRRISIERRFNGDSIRLVVPGSFLQGATLPVTVDPPITSFVAGPNTAGATSPDITYAGVSERYFVCWEEVTSLSNSDVYLTSFDRSGNGGAIVAVEMGIVTWQAPRVAYIPAGNRLLVVAESWFFSSTDRLVVGQMCDAVSGARIGNEFTISGSDVVPRTELDVGGTNRMQMSSNHFLVAWSRQDSAGSWSLRARVIDWTGAPITGIQTITSTVGEQARQVAVSESHGDESLVGDLWTIAWIRDVDADGFGQVWARRIAFNGNPALGAGNFVVDARDDCRAPSVTSRLDEALFGDRPSIVAYERKPNFAGFMDSGIYAAVVTDGVAYASNSLSSVRQDLADPLRDQTSPSIASDGSGFLLTYVEQGASQDTYFVSGHVAINANGCAVALAERGVRMTASSRQDVQCRVASIQDGDATSILDDGACVWIQRVAGSDTGFVDGFTLDIATLGTPSDRAVGVQYCDAYPNAGGQSSWLAIYGDQSRLTTHVAVCVDVTPNAFGYLLCSESPGNVDMPGGSAGRLCLSGSIGRYVAQTGFSGAARRLTSDVLPLSLPQPTGSVAAAAGETWYFQYWHRDVASGVPTSNFSNGCALYFLP